MYEIDNVADELTDKIVLLSCCGTPPKRSAIQALLRAELHQLHDCGIIEVRSEDPDYS